MWLVMLAFSWCLVPLISSVEHLDSSALEVCKLSSSTVAFNLFSLPCRQIGRYTDASVPQSLSQSMVIQHV
jgi:hypothetical protein